MKIAHFSDLHYCTKHLSIVDEAFGFAVDEAIKHGAECAVISGDSFDSAISVHEPAVAALMRRVQWLADHMPVLILQGTFSHDRPGSLDVFKTIGARYPVYVSDHVEVVKLAKNAFDDYRYRWVLYGEYEDNFIDCAAFFCLPSLNKAELAALEWTPANYVNHVMSQWCETETDLIPRVMVSHGTVNGCVTESKHAMISPDHEFSADVLFSSRCNAIMLGHIHKHQNWSNTLGQVIAYPGSITRLVFGHNDPVGFLMWDVFDDGSFFDFVPTPAPRLIEILFDGAPDIDELKTYAADVNERDHVRIRYSIDQDYAHTIDKDEIRELFSVSVLKIEGTVNPVQSVRAKGIGTAMTLPEKLGYWAVTTGDEDRLPALEDRLHMLQSMELEQILESLLKPVVNRDVAA